jgi:hypothetical protein
MGVGGIAAVGLAAMVGAAFAARAIQGSTDGRRIEREHHDRDAPSAAPVLKASARRGCGSSPDKVRLARPPATLWPL